jgi:isoquinoline 1-oxidoreductase beta subunit
MTDNSRMTRRHFLVSVAAVGGGLVLGVALPKVGRAAGEIETGSHEVNAWVIVQPDNTVIIRVARSEMGQGILTALPMLVAEELACDWTKVRAEYAAPEENLRRNRVFGPMLTGGSRSVRESQEYLRQAGATAREMLIAAAAARWGVPAAECTAAQGVITHRPSGRTVTFGEVAEDAARQTPPDDLTLKTPAQWTLLGTRVTRLDTPDKLTGKAVFGIDVRVPDMLHAAIRQSPVFGGRLTGYDEAVIRGRKGVHRVVPLPPDAIAVVADTSWQAEQALQALPVTWDDGPAGNVSSTSIREQLREGLTATTAAVVRQDGDVDKALSAASQRLEADYYAPYLAHATMEPQNCTAHVTAERVEIWVPTQNGEAALAAAAAAAEIDASRVVVHKTLLGGGFGRRGTSQDFVRQAVRIAKTGGRPVQLLWSRGEDMAHDFYRPVAMARFAAGLDASGRPVAWRTRIAGHSIVATLFPERLGGGIDRSFLNGLHDLPYQVPNVLLDYAMRNTHVPVGFWRSVNHSQNAFFRECFVDEMAHAAGADPYEYRRMLLAPDSKDRAVIEAAATRAGWGSPLPAGVFRGIAVMDSYGSYVAQVAEISISGHGELRVHRIVCAIDPGHVVNPDTIQAQVESGIVYGLTAALYGEITIEHGRVLQGNFDSYRMLRVHEMPTVEVVLVPSGGFWGGVGEPGLPPLAPALCNAIFAATGKRIRALPLTHYDLRHA